MVRNKLKQVVEGFELKSAPDAYDLALAQEREAWQALHHLQRTDPAYAAALLRWRNAADSIGIAAELLVKKRAAPATAVRSTSPQQKKSPTWSRQRPSDAASA
jgi:hypothetical protein